MCYVAQLIQTRLNYDSPVLSIVGSEIIHVATLGEIHGVLRLPLFGHLDVDQVAGVLDYELALIYSPNRRNAPTLRKSIESYFNTVMSNTVVTRHMASSYWLI